MFKKRISPKRYIYENGNLVIKEMKDESNQISLKKKIIEEFYEVQPKKNYQSLLENYKSNNILNIKLQYPKLSPINNNQGNNKNNKIFSTEIDNKIGGSPRIEEIEKKIMMNYLKESDDNDNENDEDNDYNINNLKSLEINPSYIRRNPKFKRILEQSKISSQIEDICKYMYTSPRKNDEDNIRFKMHEKENEYIKHLTKNYLVDEDLIKKNSLRKNRGNNMIKKNISIESNFIPNNKNKNTSNSLNDDEIIKQYYDKQTSNTIDVEKLTSLRFENYSRNYPRYKHPKIYRLKSGNKIIKDSEKSLLPPIRNGGYNSIDLSDFIPVKKGITKPEQRKEYFHYKIMRNKRPEIFHL
jgi:hypothetical protein